MRNFANKAKEKALMFKNRAMLRMAGCTDLDKLEAGDQLLEVLGIIIIAVVILIFFRKQIIDLFKNAMTNTNTKIQGLFNDAT